VHEDAERYATIAAALAGHAPLEHAVVAVERLPPGAPYRSPLAAALLERALPERADLKSPVLRHFDALTRIIDADPPSGPAWPRTRAVARAIGLGAAAVAHDLADPEAALAEIDRLMPDVGDDKAGRVTLESARLAVSLAQGLIRRDDPFQAEAWTRMRAVYEDGGPAGAPMVEILDEMRDLFQSASSDLPGRIQKFQDAVDRLPPGSPFRPVAQRMVDYMAPFADSFRTPDVPAPATGDAALDDAFAGMRLVRPEANPTVDDLAEGVRRLRASVAGAPPGHPQRAFYLFGLAMGLVRWSEQTNEIDDLPEAEKLLIEARGLIRGPQDELWTVVHGLLAEVRERMGASADATADAVEGLRTYFWQVLMQPDVANANAVAREAASSALSAARRCLRLNDPAGAVRALDAGRGLSLYAATELSSVAERLTRAGHPELARRWHDASTAGGQPSAELRREMIAALSSAAPGGAPLDPPSTAQIRQALVTLDADALVYLMPAGEGASGFAVAVPADGPLAYIGLSHLRPDSSPEVDAYLREAGRRDATIVGRGEKRDLGSLDQEFAGRLDAICDWAWRAAMGPLIDKLVPALRNRPFHRVPRLVLIPMGELALIPWQAARRSGGDYAVRSVALSQAASARLLVHSASRPTAPLSRIGMIVGDPDTRGVAVSLPGARAEAYEIRRCFYRGGRYLGRPPGDDTASPSGAGTAEEIRMWLTDAGPAAGTTLHLACHGVVDPGAASSYLLLAGGEPLAADRLIELMTGAPERLVGLVVLAACSTGLAAGVYDEAYSLGTAFLAGGACSVLSTLWTIPDAGTSLLMFMFHHFRVIGRRPVWEALHRAQLWMIDPDRTPPKEMPESLSRQAVGTDPADVTAWAGFLHGGR
jgi:hypothetical protein